MFGAEVTYLWVAGILSSQTSTGLCRGKPSQVLLMLSASSTNTGPDKAWIQIFLAPERGITTHTGKYSGSHLFASGPSPSPPGTKTPRSASEALNLCQLCGRRAKESQTP